MARSQKDQTERRVLERQRATAVMNRLVYLGRRKLDEYRVHAPALANRVGDLIGGSRLDALKDCLHGTSWPTPETFWYYGESLRQLGVPWCSGLWMLWASGHIDDAVGVIVTWLDAQDRDDDTLDAVWHAFVTATRLASPALFDDGSAFASRFVGTDRLSRETYEFIWHACAGQERLYALRPYIGFLDREIAKTPWLAINRKSTELKAAFEAWLRSGRTLPAGSPLGELAQATLDVASSDLRLTTRERAVLVILAQWLTGLQIGSQFPPYLRPIDPAYEVTVPEAFVGEPPPLPAFGLPGLLS
jgi:hypothetical protein